MSFCIGKDRLTNGAKILETNDRGALLELDKEGAGILIPEFLSRKERYFIFKVTTLIISKKPGNTGISRDIRTEFTTDLLLSD